MNLQYTDDPNRMRQSYRIHSWLMLLILLLWFNFIIPLIIVEGLQGVVVGGSDEILLSETNDRYKENHERNSLGLDEQRSKTQEAGGAVEASPNVFVNSILSEEDLKIIEAKLITLKREGEFGEIDVSRVSRFLLLLFSFQFILWRHTFRV